MYGIDEDTRTDKKLPHYPCLCEIPVNKASGDVSHQFKLDLLSRTLSNQY